MATELSDKTMIKLPIALAITFCVGLITFGGTYFALKNNVEKTASIDVKYGQDIKDLYELIDKNEALDRNEREKIRKEESDRHKEMNDWYMQYLKDEVGGLRSDWDRDRTEQNRRLNKLD